MWCPSCGDEYRPGFVRCPDCARDLVDVPPAPAPAPSSVVKTLSSVAERGLVEYPLDDLSNEQIELLQFMLRGADLRFSWERPRRLIVGSATADQVDEILDFVDASGEAPAIPDTAQAQDEVPVRLAARWRRFVGSCIDAAVLGVAALPLRHVGWGTPLLLFLAYETCAVALWGKTVGKFVFRIRVAALGLGTRPRWSAAAIRAVVPVLGTLLMGLAEATEDISRRVAWLVGALWTLAVYLPVFGVDRRGLHDRAAGTAVLADY